MAIGKVFGRNLIERSFQIERHVGIGIFVDRQRSRSVLNKEVQQADLEFSQFGQRLDDLPGNQVKTPRFGGQLNRPLESIHGDVSSLALVIFDGLN
jgi:hypothetical protein